MYKIYVNGTPLFLCTTKEAGEAPFADDKNIVTRYMGNHRLLLNYLDMLEKNSSFDSVTVFADDSEQLFQDFTKHFKIIEAAGGVVYNHEGEALLIFRRDHWDLPKGKIDKGESREDAAVREVMEETGLSAAVLGDYLGLTYHTYRDRNNRRILKYTYWYRMKAEKESLTPQVDEDIEKAQWRSLKPFLDANPVVYGNIKDLLERELQN